MSFQSILGAAAGVVVLLSTASALAQTPVAGGHLTYGLSSFPPCLDRVQSNPNPAVFQQVVDNLLDQDPQTGKIVPYLADKWEIGDSGRTYTFHLRSGVTFSNGEALTSKVVADNFNLLWTMGKEGTAVTAASFLTGFKSAAATDPNTVVISFEQPNAGFEQAATEKGLAILAPETLKATLSDRCTKGVIGSGPFVISTIQYNESVTLKRREDYNWGSATFKHKGPAHLETLTLRSIPERSVRVGSFVSGEVQAFFDASTDDLPNLEASGASIISGTSSGITGVLLINTSVPLLGDKAVRQALQVAINRQEIIDGLFAGHIKPATGVLSTNHPGYLDQSAVLAFDPARAATLLDEAGWIKGADEIRAKDGNRLSVKINYSGAAEQPVFELIQQQLRNIGIESTLVAQSSAEQIEARKAGNWQLDWRTWGRADVDALNFVYSTALSQNRGMTVRSELDAKLKAVAGEADAGKRKQLADDAQKEIVREAYGLPIREVTLLVPVAENVHGFYLTNDPFRPVFYDTWIDGQGN
ncbi:MAG: ABC transporter substrate-binding protein [Phyllobacterium sp.]